MHDLPVFPAYIAPARALHPRAAMSARPLLALALALAACSPASATPVDTCRPAGGTCVRTDAPMGALPGAGPDAVCADYGGWVRETPWTARVDLVCPDVDACGMHTQLFPPTGGGARCPAIPQVCCFAPDAGP